MANSYADLVASETYRAGLAGAALEILLVDPADITKAVVGASVGFNYSEQYEVVPREEAGNTGVDEHVQGRHRGTCSMNHFWTAETNDKLPTRASFIGKKFCVIVRIGKGQPMEGVVVDVFLDCTLNSKSSNIGARGARMSDLAFDFTRRLSGQEWADEYGA